MDVARSQCRCSWSSTDTWQNCAPKLHSLADLNDNSSTDLAGSTRDAVPYDPPPGGCADESTVNVTPYQQ